MHDWQKLWRHGNTLASLKLSKQIVQFTKSSPNFWQGCVDILEEAIFVLKLRSRTYDSWLHNVCCHLRFNVQHFPAFGEFCIHTNTTEVDPGFCQGARRPNEATVSRKLHENEENWTGALPKLYCVDPPLVMDFTKTSRFIQSKEIASRRYDRWLDSLPQRLTALFTVNRNSTSCNHGARGGSM